MAGATADYCSLISGSPFDAERQNDIHDSMMINFSTLVAAAWDPSHWQNHQLVTKDQELCQEACLIF